jgi:hypothetical protein
LPRRWRRQQLSPLSAPCIPSPPSLFDCQMPRDDTVVAIFVVIASVISFLPPPSRPDNAAATPTTQWHTRRFRHPSLPLTPRRRRPSNTTARLPPRRHLNNVNLTTPRHARCCSPASVPPQPKCVPLILAYIKIRYNTPVRIVLTMMLYLLYLLFTVYDVV